jgi:hypothetical protein
MKIQNKCFKVTINGMCVNEDRVFYVVAPSISDVAKAFPEASGISLVGDGCVLTVEVKS